MIVAVLSATASAQGPARGRTAALARKDRKIATREIPRSALRVRVAYDEDPPLFEARLGLTAGLSFLSGGEMIAGAPSTVAGFAAPSGSATIDLRAFSYLGVEGDAQYALAASRLDASGGTRERQITSLTGALKGQIPFGVPGNRFTPKAGVGYGVLTMTTRLDNAGSVTNETIRLSNPYLLFGMEWEPFDRWVVWTDFTLGFSISGTAQSGSGRIDAGTARSDRFQAGVLYRFAPRFLGGMQYVRRTADFVFPSGGGIQSTKLNQNSMVGTLLFEL